ncbi:NAD(P)-dependent oxidoreductase [Altererythrobacter lauratis]|uniref:DUF1932 domain-containing protein n=1 Tax=Alteraurantiacibacter lauratis TaxID=2054627 RepID=A0ABV7EIA8_9SPHN
MSPPQPHLAPPCVALIGFGEAGSTFANAGGWEDAVFAFDSDPSRRAAMEDCGVRPASSPAEAMAKADVVLSLVTADQALPAARDYAPMLQKGALWIDMNSVAPQTKAAAAQAVEEAGGRYADVAVMAPVDPARLNVPLLIAGPHAADAMAALRDLGFAKTRVVGNKVGQASAIKLCRSVMVKGLEALTAEMVLAANAAGVLDEVLASLDASEKHVPWAERADYNLDRMIAHGQRRSAEMAEAAAMLRDLGIAPLMTENTVKRQQGIGALGIAPVPPTLNAKIAAITAKTPS